MKIKIGMAFIVMAISYYGYNKANSIDFDLPSIKEGKIVISDDNKDKYYKKLPQYIKHDNSNISIFIDYNSKSSFLLEKAVADFVADNSSSKILVKKTYGYTKGDSDYFVKIHDSLRIIGADNYVDELIYRHIYKNKGIENKDLNIILIKGSVDTGLFWDVFKSRDLDKRLKETIDFNNKSLYNGNTSVVVNGRYYIDASAISTKNAIEVLNHTIRIPIEQNEGQ